MSNIPSQFSPAGFSSRQNALPDAQFSNYMQQRAVSAREQLNAGLTIQTREGDLVTLNASSYNQFDAYSYDRQGVVKTQDGQAMVQQSYREITLASGEAFSFSVSGHLNEEELEDIESIVQDIDQIIEEMTQGDMDDAVAIALEMGGYDEVSSFSADIAYERSYSAAVQTEAVRGGLEQPESLEMPENIDDPQTGGLMDKIAQRLGEMDEKPLDQIRNPIDNLFDHHMNRMDREDDTGGLMYNALNEARKQMEELIDQLLDDAFERHFSDMLDS